MEDFVSNSDLLVFIDQGEVQNSLVNPDKDGCKKEGLVSRCIAPFPIV